MNWLKNAWYVAGFKSELDGGAVVARRLLNTAVVMLRHSDGRVAALEDVGAPSAALNDTIGTLMVDLLDNADENTTWLDVAKQLRTAVLADPVAAADLPEGSGASQLRAILNGMGVQPEQYQAAALD